jgi:asparagine synthetase B (glutamine-hydrolysing)
MRFSRQSLGALFLVGGLSAGAWAQSQTGERLLSILPRYDPSVRAAREAERATQVARPPEDDPNVLVLPDYVVRETKIFRPTEREVQTRAARAKEAMRVYARDMNALELALNRWHIPFITPSFAQRALADQERKERISQWQGYAHLAAVAEKVDPAGAKAIREALQRR